MGYTTHFSGEIEIDPPLNEHELSFLQDLAKTRRMARTRGPLFVGETSNHGQAMTEDIVDYNHANGEQKMELRDGAFIYLPVADDGVHEPDGQPSLWLQWRPTDDGTALEWDGGEKFYAPAEWMKYLVSNVLAPSARAYIDKHIGEDPRLAHFTCDHVCKGEIRAEGEDPDDRWMLVVKDNVVLVADAVVTYANPREV